MFHQLTERSRINFVPSALILRDVVEIAPRVSGHVHRRAHADTLISDRQFPLRDVTGKSIQGDTAMETEFFVERSSKRRKGFPSETRVKRGFPTGSL